MKYSNFTRRYHLFTFFVCLGFTMTGLPKIRPKPWDTIIPVKSSSGVQAGNAQNDSWGGSGFASEFNRLID